MKFNHEANAVGLFVLLEVFSKFAFLVCSLACVLVWNILSTLLSSLQGISFVASGIATYFFVNKVVPEKLPTLWTVVLAILFFTAVSEIIMACFDRRTRANYRGFWSFLPKLKKALTSPIDPTHAGAAVGLVAAIFSGRHVYSMDLSWYSMAGLMLVAIVSAYFIAAVAVAFLWDLLFPVKSVAPRVPASEVHVQQLEQASPVTEKIAAAAAAAAAPLRLEDMTQQQILDQTRSYIESTRA